MSRKLLIKYILMYFPAVLGMILFCSGVVNLFSSLLLFLGGYIAIKNTFDYRLIRKNISSVNKKSILMNIVKDDCVCDEITKVNDRGKIKTINSENIIGVKRIRKYSRVRRKY